MRGIVFNKVSCHLSGHTIHVTHLVSETDTVKFVCILKQLWPESRCDKLGFVTQLVNHVSDCLSVLCI